MNLLLISYYHSAYAWFITNCSVQYNAIYLVCVCMCVCQRQIKEETRWWMWSLSWEITSQDCSRWRARHAAGWSVEVTVWGRTEQNSACWPNLCLSTPQLNSEVHSLVHNTHVCSSNGLETKLSAVWSVHQKFAWHAHRCMSIKMQVESRVSAQTLLKPHLWRHSWQ